MNLIFTVYLWREWEEPRSESLLEIFKRKEDLTWVFKVFHSIQVCWVRKTSLSMKTQISHLLSQLKAFFHQLQNFLFHRTPWDTLFHLKYEIKHVSSWSYMRISSYEAMLIFLAFGRIFITHTWFWLFIMFIKFVSLRTCSNLMHMIIRNQVENF